ncbi:chalcone isomerase family protein [Asticcacaulis sp. BYS171W]|uniref:Chalcone isomerase family protein n=1 Tax=Asticcacaulis aquaticus TaxID=2984212 RepID=A0ABT5HUU2_9CAUL|nr:chalcone isomerase family protein [Asticcacaulis aquaticus]MDC7683851.1 chalcone isomerase family protein [Asticcacaulis aquaticus]
MTHVTRPLDRRLFLIVVTGLVVVPQAFAAVPGVADAQKMGTARYSAFGLSIFDATLYAPGGTYKTDAPFALRLDYLKSFGAARIVDNSVKEIRRQGFADEARLAAWKRQMSAIFPDIRKGDHIVGVRDQGGNTAFYHNGKAIGSIKDAQFTRHFFNIWLGPNAPAAFRQKLLGGA